MKKKTETSQAYKVEDGKMLIAQLTKTELKKERFFSSPIDALDNALESHRHLLRNQEYHLKHRKEIVDKLQDVYLHGEYYTQIMMGDVEKGYWELTLT